MRRDDRGGTWLGFATSRVTAALFLVFLFSRPLPVLARPVPTRFPGGSPGAADTVVIDYAVRSTPSLLSLRAVGPLGVEVGESKNPDGLTLLRRDTFPGVPDAHAEPADPHGESISFSGLKSVSVELGKNRSASLEQSLDLTIRGRVAGEVEVAATLSDRQLPFEPDGSSRELEDLDQLSLSVRAPKAEATMGSFLLDGIPGEFVRLSRHLEGVRGAAQARGARWNVAVANEKGEKRTVEFHGEEGRQGPYPLVSSGVAAAAIGVVAGSEIVWLDGARMKRGAEDDYIVDYGTGTVTFTVRHPITAQTRIAVDFEASASRFHRSLYAATTQGGVAGRGSWYASYFSEGDDSNRPVGVELSSADREALSQIGDSAAMTLPSGVRYMGSGQGSYAWDESDPSSLHWIYLGAARGDYEVEFSSVGPGRGAYGDTTASDGSRFYRFRGQNLGAFAPGRTVAVPSSNKLFDFGGAAHLLGAVALEAEIARSGFDRNALSSRDDGDNTGGAARFAARLDPRRVSIGGRGLGSLRAQGHIRSRGERFQPFDRMDPAFEGERWNQGAGTGGEDRQEIAVQYDPAATLSLRGDAGRRILSGESSSLRRAARAEFRAGVASTLRWEEARNSEGGQRGVRSLWGFDVSREKGRVMPRIAVREERIQGQGGDSVDMRSSREIQFGLRLAPSSSIRIRGGYGLRGGEVVPDVGGPGVVERASTWDGGILARSGSSFSIDGGYTRRRAESAGGAQATDLAQLSILAGRPGAPVTSELRYDVTQLREPALIRELRPVVAGGGSYDLFGNARLGGGYELVTTSGKPATRSRAVVQLRLDAYPARAAVPQGRKRPAWRGMGGSSYFRLETLSTLPLGALDHAIDPGAYLAPGSTLRGNLIARQTLESVPPAGRYDARAEIGFRRDRNEEIQTLHSGRDAWDGRVSLRHPLPPRLRLTASGTFDGAMQSIRRVGTEDEYRSLIRGRGLELEVSREIRGNSSVSLLSRLRRDIDGTHGGSFDSWSAGPTARYTSGARLRLDARALWGRGGPRGVYAPPGLYVVSPVGSRLDYDMLGEYRVNSRVSLTFSWTGFKAPNRAGTYTGRFEMRGTF